MITLRNFSCRIRQLLQAETREHVFISENNDLRDAGQHTLNQSAPLNDSRGYVEAGL
jgi:hypothetical protein